MMSDDNNLERRDFLAGAVATAGLFVATSEAEAQEKRPGGLSTHVLDTYSGIPASGMKIDFLIADGDGYKLDKSIETNEFGRTDHPVMPVVDQPGKFQLVFYVADYFKAKGLDLPDPNFLDKVAIHFAIANPQEHYHVPLLCSPWSYVTYRGS
jgi:5-hydroxyisourate hydrolase